MVQQRSKCQWSQSFLLLIILPVSFFLWSAIIFFQARGRYRATALGALPVIIDLGGTKPLGGICIYLGGTSDPQGNHDSSYANFIHLVLYVFFSQ